MDTCTPVAFDHGMDAADAMPPDEAPGLRQVQPRYAVTTGDLDHLTAAPARDYVRDVERAGFGMLWLAEVLGREAFTTAYLALAATRTMMVGNGVARALERVPKNAAAAQAGLSEAKPGRYVLGLGDSSAERDREVGPKR